MMCKVLNMNVCVTGINNACVAMHTYIHGARIIKVCDKIVY